MKDEYKNVDEPRNEIRKVRECMLYLILKLCMETNSTKTGLEVTIEKTDNTRERYRFDIIKLQDNA